MAGALSRRDVQVDVLISPQEGSFLAMIVLVSELLAEVQREV